MYVPTCGTNVIYLNAYLNHSAEHADEGWIHVHDAPDDTNRRGADSGLSDVWRRGSSESSSTRKVMIDDSGERDTRAGIGKLTDAEM